MRVGRKLSVVKNEGCGPELAQSIERNLWSFESTFHLQNFVTKLFECFSRRGGNFILQPSFCFWLFNSIRFLRPWYNYAPRHSLNLRGRRAAVSGNSTLSFAIYIWACFCASQNGYHMPFYSAFISQFGVYYSKWLSWQPVITPLSRLWCTRSQSLRNPRNTSGSGERSLWSTSSLRSCLNQTLSAIRENLHAISEHYPYSFRQRV